MLQNENTQFKGTQKHSKISDTEPNYSWLSNYSYLQWTSKITFVVISNFSSMQVKRKWKQIHNSVLI